MEEEYYMTTASQSTPRSFGDNRYLVQGEPLGAGACGVVYRAWDTRIRRKVAIKVMGAEIEADSTWRARFLREAQLAASVHHPSIIKVFDFGEEQGKPYMVLELLEDGCPLGKRMQRESGMTLQAKLDLLEQYSDGLACLHAKNIIHRDIKLSNLWVHEDGRGKIMDFGLARHLDAAALTRTGTFAGTPRYAAPEQIRLGTADARSDVYSLSMVGWELVAGKRAYEGDTLAVLFAVVHRDPEPLLLLAPSCPAAVASLLERGIHKDAAHRFQNGAELSEALRVVRRQLARTGVGVRRSPEHLPEETVHVELPGLADYVRELLEVARARPGYRPEFDARLIRAARKSYTRELRGASSAGRRY
jgi:eukaryotic-like serine/threonine-protein kinase